ncbi:hypothetical protein ACFE04_020544 [Oxalis oulophora]
MEIDDVAQVHGVLPFQLQFDKPVPSQIKFAEWNPDKDLLAIVTEDDSKLILHRFNWQRLWTISPGKCITSLCWRPDGKAIALGLEDGTLSFHDVENGKLLTTLNSHTVAVVCLNWEEDAHLDDSANISTYEDRTSRFLPPHPRVPRMPGLVSGDNGFIDGHEDSFREPSIPSHQRFNVLCSGDKDGSICFSIFGIFPIGKINIHNFCALTPNLDNRVMHRLVNASIHKVSLSKDLCRLIIVCSGELDEVEVESRETQMDCHSMDMHGLHCLALDTSIFSKRKNELHQVAQQASNIEDLNEVIRASLSVMYKQWSDAMHTFHEKFDPLSSLIVDHGLDSSPQEEFLSLLGGARTSPPVHQFLVNSLGESGMKRVSKVVSSAGKELQHIALDHLQPAAEIIAFRVGELRGLSRWRARYKAIGLDESLVNDATEKAGMLLIQIERFMKVLSSVVQQFSNFFNWLLKCIKLLMQETNDQPLQYNSELLVIFLKFLYDRDPVKLLLDLSEVDHYVEVDSDTMQRAKELVKFGGFSDCDFLQRTLAKEFGLMELSFREAFVMPFNTISQKISCKDLLPLFPTSTSITIPTSISYYEDMKCENGLVSYVSFRIPDEPSEIANCIGIVRGFMHDLSKIEESSLEAVLLSVPAGYYCVDLSLYKENQIVLLLNKSSTTSESSGEALMMIVQASDLPFIQVPRAVYPNFWTFRQLKDSVINLQIENEKARCIPHSVTTPLAVSASRGVACVFAVRKRALVYILEEDEDEADDVSTDSTTAKSLHPNALHAPLDLSDFVRLAPQTTHVHVSSTIQYNTMQSLKLVSHQYLNYIHSLPIKPLFFSSLPSQQHTLLFDFLIKTLNLSQKDAFTISTRFSNRKSLAKPQTLVNYLQTLGLSDTQVKSSVRVCPQLLFCNIDKTLKPKIEFLQDHGILGSDLQKLVSKKSHIFTHSLKKKMLPCVEVIKNALLNRESKHDLALVLRRGSSLFAGPVDRLSRNIAFLESCGIVGSQLSLLLQRQPRLFAKQECELKDFVSKVVNLGFSTKSRMLVHGLHTLSCLSQDTFEKKFKIFRGFGFSHDEFMLIFTRAPGVLRMSPEKLKLGLDFFLNTVKLDKEVIYHSPSCLMHNMDDRVIPRYKVLQIIKMKKLSKKKEPSFLNVVRMTEEDFLKSYVIKFRANAEELLVAYKGHLCDSDLE